MGFYYFFYFYGESLNKRTLPISEVPQEPTNTKALHHIVTLVSDKYSYYLLFTFGQHIEIT